jgi:hypothetical protein
MRVDKRSITLQSKIGDLIKKRTKGDVGIEIEAEGTLVLTPMEVKYWQQKSEPSLRNGGVEMATASVLPISDVDAAIDEYIQLFSKSKFVPSWRTSVHIHVNAIKLTLQEIFTVMMAYWAFEDPLCRMNGATREGNLHCLRLRDAEGSFFLLRQELTGGVFLGRGSTNDFRYAAFNLASLQKFGSIEFRFMRFPDDLHDVAMFAKALHSLVTKAKDMTYSDIAKLYGMAPRQAALMLFPEDFVTRMFAEIPQQFIQESMYYHEAFANMLTTSLKSVKTLTYLSERDLDLDPAFPDPDNAEVGLVDVANPMSIQQQIFVQAQAHQPQGAPIQNHPDWMFHDEFDEGE